MTERKITYALRKIEAARKEGFFIEALFRIYHLNTGLLKQILFHQTEDHRSNKQKIRKLLRQIDTRFSDNTEMKAVINRQSFKSVVLWYENMLVFLKEIKNAPPRNIKDLVEESMKIFGILNISANKIFAKNRA